MEFVPRQYVDGRPAASLALPRTPAKMISAFQTGHGWTTTGAASSNLNDTTDYVYGTQSAKLTTTATVAAALRKTAMPAMDITGKSFRVLLKVDGVAGLNSLQAYFGSGGFANFYTLSLFNPGEAAATLGEGQWRWLEFNCSASALTVGGGTPSKTTITDMQLRVTDNGTPLTMHVNAWGWYPDPTQYPNGVVSLTFDDSYKSQFTQGCQYMDRYGFPGTAFIICDQTGYDANHLSMADLHQMHDTSLWDIAAHSLTAVNHNKGFDNLTSDELEQELTGTKRYLNQNGWGREDYLAYPKGQHNAATQAAVGKYYSFARTVDFAPLQVLPPVYPMLVRCKAMGPSATLASCQAIIDRAYSDRGWAVFCFHDIVPTATIATDTSITTFRGIVDYCATKGIPVATMGEVMRVGA